ncbi:cytochrome P450 [Halenospora varia]|nr:cytochrome P450 [Halenospora varia]
MPSMDGVRHFSWASALTEINPWLYLAITALYELLWVIYAHTWHSLADVPGPFWASISRTWLWYQIWRGDMEIKARKLHEKHGKTNTITSDFVRIAPNEVSISDANAIKTIYGSGNGFTKTDFYTIFASNLSPHGDHFTQTDEKKHGERRRIVSGIYSMTGVLESEQYINACSALYSFDVVGELFFGKMFSFMKDRHDFGGYISALDTLLPPFIMVVNSVPSCMFPADPCFVEACVLPSYFRTFVLIMSSFIPAIQAALKGYDKILAAAKACVTDRLELMKRNKVERTDVLDKFFQISKEDETFGVPEIQTEAFVAMFAGSDTTAIAMRSIFYHLRKNSSIYQKVVQEIDEAVAAGQLGPENISYSDSIKLPYLSAACKEAMRIHPSVALTVPRYVPKGGKMISGRYFHHKDRVDINPAVVQFDKSIFGEDANEFNPERWFRTEDLSKMNRAMIQFGAGSRTCIGKNIALAEIHKLIPQLLRLYQIDLAYPVNAWKTNNAWFYKQTDFKVRITRRDKNKIST